MLAFIHRYLACLTGLFRLTFSFRPVLCVALSLFLLSSRLAAQTVAPSESESDEPITLDPFTVTTSAAAGYGAQLSSSSSRLDLRYVDVPQTVSVVTAEFLKDAFIFDRSEEHTSELQ